MEGPNRFLHFCEVYQRPELRGKGRPSCVGLRQKRVLRGDGPGGKHRGKRG